MTDHGTMYLAPDIPDPIEISDLLGISPGFDFQVTLELAPDIPGPVQIVDYQIAGTLQVEIPPGYTPPSPYHWPRGDLDAT